MDHLVILQAQQALVSGLYRDVINILDSSPNLDRLPEYWHLKAIAHILQGEFSTALQELETAKELTKGEDPRIVFDMALVHWNLGDVDLAKSELRSISGSLIYAPLVLMVLLWSLGDFEELEELTNEIISSPENYSMPILGYAYYFSALLKVYLGDLKGAYKDALTSYKLLPRFDGNKFLLATLLIKARKHQEAEKVLSNVSDDYKNLRSFISIINKYLEGSSPEELIDSADQLLQEMPDNPQLWYLLGYLNLMRRDISKALNYFKGAFLLESTNSDYRNAFAITLALSGKIGKALKLLERGNQEEYPSYIKDNLSRLIKLQKEIGDALS